jgi:hypothetical protein
LESVLARNCCGRDGIHKKKGRLRCHKRPKSREETPKEGNDSGGYRLPLTRRSRSAAQLDVRDHGPIRRFMALALKADHFRTRRRPSLASTLPRHRPRPNCVSVTTTDTGP